MISRGYVHFQPILRETESKRLKFPSQWSKVAHVLGPLNRAMAILVTRPRPEVFKPKNTQNGNNSRFSGGCVHFQQILRETESKRLKFRSRWSKVPRVLGPLNRAMAILVSRPRLGEVFKPKNTQNGNRSRFPGATCIISKRLKFRSRWSKVPRVLGPLNRAMAILVIRLRPGEVFKPKNTQNGNK